MTSEIRTCKKCGGDMYYTIDSVTGDTQIDVSECSCEESIISFATRALKNTIKIVVSLLKKKGK